MDVISTILGGITGTALGFAIALLTLNGKLKELRRKSKWEKESLTKQLEQLKIHHEKSLKERDNLIEQLKANLEQLEKTKKELNSQLSNFQKDIQKIEAIKKEKELLEKNLSELKQTISKLEEEKKRERELSSKELEGLNKEIAKLRLERDDLLKQLSQKEQQIKALDKNLQDTKSKLDRLQLEKKNLENLINQLKSKLSASVPKEAVAILTELKHKIDQLLNFFKTGEQPKEYKLIVDEEHDETFSRIFASEKVVLITAPFLTEDAVRKRLPEIERFLAEGGKLYLMIGRNWNSSKDNSLLTLLHSIAKYNGQIRVFLGDLHHKVIAGEKLAVITSFNFLSKNNRQKEVGILVENPELANALFKTESENASEYERLSYARFKVLSASDSSTGKSIKIETDCNEFPVVYYTARENSIEVGKHYEAALIIKDKYTLVAAIRDANLKEEQILAETEMVTH